MPRSRSLAAVCTLGLALATVACASEDGGGSTSETAGSSTGVAATVGPGGEDSSAGSSGSGVAPTTGTASAGTTSGATEGVEVSSSGASSGTWATTESETTEAGTEGSSEGGSSEGGSSEGGSSESGEMTGAEFRVLQLNLCHSGVAGCFKGDAVMVKAAAVIKSVAPTLVTLNEVCRKDLPALAAETGALDFQFTPALKADDKPVKCKNGEDYGMGLLSWAAPKWGKATHGVYAAQSSMTERRVWLCMGYEGFVGCTTHLSTKGATALAQCKALVSGALAEAAAEGPALMAGDWNMKYKGTPNAQDCVPAGFYRKGDGTLQHVLASQEFAFVETIVIDMEGSTDHPGLEVRMTLP